MLLSTFAILYFHHKERRGSKRKDIESAIMKGNKEILRRHTDKKLEESTRGSRHFPAPPSSAQVDRRNNVAQHERKWDNTNPPDVNPPRRGARDNNGRIGSLRLDDGFYVTIVPSPRPGLPARTTSFTPSATSHSSAFSAARTSSDIGVLTLFPPRAQFPTNGSRSRNAVETDNTALRVFSVISSGFLTVWLYSAKTSLINPKFVR